jgi:hypothetical protein
MNIWDRVARCAPGIAVAFAAGAAIAATQSLTILHDNDIHGHLRAFCYVEVAKGPDEHCDTGGAARRATLVKQLRAEAKAPTLLIDSGDTTTRGPLATQYEGVDEIAAMNAIGYDLAAVGNNEFKLKDAADIHDAAGAQADLARLVRESHFPWICANATLADGSPLPGVKPFLVRWIGRLRVAFLGLTTQRSQGYPQTKGLKFTDPVEAANRWVPKARAEADVVIVVSHIGVFDDRRVARGTRGIDAIVGGDSHTYLYQLAEEKNLDGAVVPIVQDGEFGVRLGVFNLTFEGRPRPWLAPEPLRRPSAGRRRGGEAGPRGGRAGRTLRPPARRPGRAPHRDRRDPGRAQRHDRRRPRRRVQAGRWDRGRHPARGRPVREFPHAHRDALPGARHHPVPRQRLEGRAGWGEAEGPAGQANWARRPDACDHRGGRHRSGQDLFRRHHRLRRPAGVGRRN